MCGCTDNVELSLIFITKYHWQIGGNSRDVLCTIDSQE